MLAVGCGEDSPTEPTPTTGKIVVNASPDSLDSPWVLTGPSGYSHNGIGDESLSSLDPGDYTLTWGAVSGWDLPDPASSTQTLTAGGTKTFSGTYTEVVTAETVSTPSAPTGPAEGVENQDLSYSASGAVSNHGDDLEYRFDWGDGTFSDWGTTAVQNSWATAATYNIRAQARCIAHPTVVSDWSAVTSVEINVFVAETVSAPVAPTGSTSKAVGLSTAYTTSGAVSSYGDDLQYRFDWGDGNFSTWSASMSASYAWAAEGSYDVRAQARCADHTTVESAWSPVTAVTITAAAGETVSTPDVPSGPAAAETGETVGYTTGGAVSSLGHVVEYRFDLGDGRVTPWLFTSTSIGHTYTAAGTYEVKAQARCRTHTSIESEWSAATTVVVSDPAEIIPNPPTTINGVAAGIIDDPYEYIVYHSSQTNLGDAVEGRFDWGDGTFSDWIAAAPFSATHTWTVEGTYTVKYEARCSVHPAITASADSLVVTITTTAVETISKPGFVNYPTDVRYPEVNIEKSYYASGGISSLGHDTEVMIDWGDGTESAWVPQGTYVSKTWAVAGTYELIRQSRCVAHPEILSEWSDPILIYPRDPETVSAPDPPDGPTVGNRNDNLRYTVRGAESSWHTGWLEYRFDWGDGSAITEWATDTIRAHQFANYGEYELKAQARCRWPGHGEPESEWSLPTTLSIVEKITISQYAPYGPYYAAVGETNTWERNGIPFSDAGHTTFEYQFDFGDGTISDWSSSETADHAYASTGNYEVRYQVRCAVDTVAVSGWSEQYRPIEVTDAPEMIETPDYPGIQAPPLYAGEPYYVSISGSYSNHGHPIEYIFYFGDGTDSGWIAGTPWSSYYQASLQHTYTSIGSYEITCKARCATHPGIESAVSPVRPIEIVEVVERPGAPTGPATGVIGANLTFTTTGSTSSEGHVLEYSFEYRRGTYSVVHTSDWSTSLTDDHVFTEAGTNYRVMVRARCAIHTNAVSYYSTAFEFTITE